MAGKFGVITMKVLTLAGAIILGLWVFTEIDSPVKRRYTAWRIRAIAAAQEENVEARLLEYCVSDCSFGAAYALDALGQLPAVSDETVTVVSSLLASDDHVVSREAALALVDISNTGTAGLSSLVETVRTGSARRDTTYFAARALSMKGKLACDYADLIRRKMLECPRSEPGFRSYERSLARINANCAKP